MSSTHSVAYESIDPDSASPVAVKAVLRIAERWQLTEADLAILMNVSVPTVSRWKRGLKQTGAVSTRLGPDALDRASYLLGIYKALHILLPNPAQADGWVRRPNTNALFEGRSPLTRMLGGRMRDLALVRQHLDGWRG